MKNLENSSRFLNTGCPSIQVNPLHVVNILPLLASLKVQSCVCQHTVFALKNFSTPPAS